MKVLFWGVSALLALTGLQPAQGSRGLVAGNAPADDTVAVDSFVWDGTEVDSAYVEVADDEGKSDIAFAIAEDTRVCIPDDDVLLYFTKKRVEHSFENPQDSNHELSFSVTYYLSDKLKKSGGYHQMLARILRSTLCDEEKVAGLKAGLPDQMVDYKWKAAKAGYIEDMGEEFALTNSYLTNIMPAWQWKSNGGLITFSVCDSWYLGGAHGMDYAYYLTFSERADSVIGLKDIFREESLPAVFALVSEKLKERDNAPQDDETWPVVAEVTPEPDEQEQMVRAGALELYAGKWYPRPALTECGVVFSYRPYVKDCFAAGTVNILLTYDEAAPYMRIRL